MFAVLLIFTNFALTILLIYICNRVSVLVQNIRDRLRANANVVVIVTAAVILLLMLTGLMLYLRSMMEDELERYAERELTMKAMVIHGVLNQTEQSLWDFECRCREFTEVTSETTVYEMLQDMTDANPHIIGCEIGFVPNYFPKQGSLFEPYVMETEDSVAWLQVGGEEHDYTAMNFYKKAIERDDIYWADPYYGGDGTHRLITTCSMPVHDRDGELMGVLGADVLLDWVSDTLNVHHSYPSSFNLLLTEEGQVISQPVNDSDKKRDVAKVIALLNDSTTLRRRSDSGRSDVIEFHDDRMGADGTIFVSYMKGYPHWQIVVVCYDYEVYGQLDHLGMVMVFLLLLTFAFLLLMINLVARNERRLQEAKTEQERIGSELRVAQNIQREMLPKRHVTTRDRDDLSILGLQVPAKEVGGDIYDYYVRDEKLFFCIGDVSGKGVPSALVMAVIHAMFRMASAHETNPARIMQTINEISAQGNESCMFVTLFLGVLDLPTGRLHYCNAGHDCPVMMGRQCQMLPVKANLPLGIVGDYAYQGQTIVMEPDSTLFLYTDGLTEAMNPQRELFRVERMMAVLDAAFQRGETTPEVLFAKMQDAVHAFVQDAEQSDDLTMLAIHFTPRPEQNLLQETLTLKNDVKEVRRLNDFVRSVTQRLQIDDSLSRNIKLAVEEAVVNVIDYAYPTDEEGEVSIKAEADAEHLRFVITDSGVAFDPTENITADTSLSVEERPIGGLGILIVRQLMDSINYERIDGHNILTLTKNYSIL